MVQRFARIGPSGTATHQLLLACGRLELDPPSRARVDASLSGGVDWAMVLAMAREHGLAPLLHRHLSTRFADRVPKAVLVELWGGYEAGLRRNRAMARELVRILTALDENGIAALPYKGPTLAQSIYGDLGLREFGDLDILLRCRDALDAKRLLEELGYASDYPLTAAGDLAMLRSPAQYHFALRSASALVELHWKTDPEFPVERDDDAWWARLPRVSLAERSVRTMSAADLFLVLCFHGTKHRWASLAWVVDVAELLRRSQEIDWHALAERADRMRARHRFLLGVRLAHDLVDAPVPAALRAALSDAAVAENARAIASELLEPSEGALLALGLLRRDLALYDTPSQRLRHVVNVIFSPSLVEWSRWPLPRALAFLYVPMRLARLAVKHLIPIRRNPAAATPRTPSPRPRSTG